MTQTAVRICEAENAAAATRRARLRRLTLSDFRSYQNADINLDGRCVAFVGPNGAGKTNILEAISLMGSGRGLRGARLEDLPRIGGPGGWAVSLRLEDGEDELRLGVGASQSAPDRRTCRIDGRAATGPSAFARHLRFLWLTPAQDRLFADGAAERRRFVDRMALAQDAAHAGARSAFEHAMRQRQRLLEDGGRDSAWLTALEAQMAESGVALAAARRETAARLAAEEVTGDDGLFPAADIALEGDLESALERAPAAAVEEDYAARLKRQRRADAEAGRALVGPHRSDLLVVDRAKGRPARLCSTGEQKALLIGLVLANARALARRARIGAADAAPLVLLFDEIAAHLDPDRRGRLFDILDELGFQVFMTGTDKALFSAWGDRAQMFEVAAGSVVETNLE
ncbi:MAG: DNA replication/repair protein RecF [Parvularculaceae bacterium]